jgi:hypothetical protein
MEPLVQIHILHLVPEGNILLQLDLGMLVEKKLVQRGILAAVPLA